MRSFKGGAKVRARVCLVPPVLLSAVCLIALGLQAQALDRSSREARGSSVVVLATGDPRDDVLMSANAEAERADVSSLRGLCPPTCTYVTQPAFDIVSLRVASGKKALHLSTRVAKAGQRALFIWRLRVGPANYFAVLNRRGDVIRKARFFVNRALSACHGLSGRIKPSGAVTVRVPLPCIGSPGTLRVGASTLHRTADYAFSDDALRSNHKRAGAYSKLSTPLSLPVSRVFK